MIGCLLRSVLSIMLLAGCVSDGTLAPTPAIHATSLGVPQVEASRGSGTTETLDLLYVTNRALTQSPGGALAYANVRSRTMSFGSVAVAIDDRPDAPGSLQVGEITPLGSFPRTPYPIRATPAGVQRAPDAVRAHERAVSVLQTEVSQRLSRTRRKEVVVFIHGYNNTFQDAAATTGNLCHFLGDEFVCVVLSWPAGGSGGVLFGYNIDRESGEYAVADMKKAIRAIAETKGLEKIHIIAHSRGTDVLASAIQQLGIETYVARTSVSERLRIANVVLFAPDIDLDVASSKIFSAVSDPDLSYGSTTRPFGAFPPGNLHVTVYSSPGDRALGLSGLLFGSILRLGQLAPAQQDFVTVANAPDFAGLVDFVEIEGGGSLLGHDYFLSDPTVSADLVALIRYGLKPGEPGRPLVEIRRPFWRITP